jgi:hypothetical protein
MYINSLEAIMNQPLNESFGSVTESIIEWIISTVKRVFNFVKDMIRKLSDMIRGAVASATSVSYNMSIGLYDLGRSASRFVSEDASADFASIKQRSFNASAREILRILISEEKTTTDILNSMLKKQQGWKDDCLKVRSDISSHTISQEEGDQVIRRYHSLITESNIFVREAIYNLRKLADYSKLYSGIDSYINQNLCVIRTVADVSEANLDWEMDSHREKSGMVVYRDKSFVSPSGHSRDKGVWDVKLLCITTFEVSEYSFR